MASDSTDSNQLQAAGDINVEEIRITTTNGFYQDITNQVIGISIYEDIYSPFISGNLTVKDSLDMMNVFPFIGEEYLNMKLSTPALGKGDMNAKFYITKMTDRQPTGDKGYIYQLHFISEAALVDINKRVSKTFSGKCSDIATQLLTDKTLGLQVEKIAVEPTINDTKFISNFWTPVKCLNYVADTSSNMNGSASYLFFEDRYGFNFVSLESMYRTEIYQEFRYDNYIRDIKPDGESARNTNEDYKRIRDIKIPTAYDYVDRASSGLFGSNLYTYDITTKIVNSTGYDAMSAFSKQYHLNKYPIFTNKAIYRHNAVIFNMSKYTENFQGFGDVTNTSVIQNRVSLMEQIKASSIEIVVPGRMDYTVGLRIVVFMYKGEPTSDRDTEVIDEAYSGSYIIAAINHFITKNSHECTMEIVKESVVKDLNKK